MFSPMPGIMVTSILEGITLPSIWSSMSMPPFLNVTGASVFSH